VQTHSYLQPFDLLQGHASARTLRTAQAYPDAITQPQALERAMGPSPILVVDDDAMHRELISLVVARAGYCAHTAENGEEGWDRLRRVDYALVIVDHEMPRLTGLKLVERLRAVSPTPPCILISVCLPAPIWILKEKVYPGAVLQKPFKIEQLTATISDLVRSGSSPPF
jgi:DNA-binding response OmpR family regulator